MIIKKKIKYFLFNMNENNFQKGALFSLVGILILIPDSLLIRLSDTSTPVLMTWRGLLMGFTLLMIWFIFFNRNEIKFFLSYKFFLVSFLSCIQSIAFTIGIMNSSVLIVLTSIATAPIFSAFLSIFFLKQKYSFLEWTAMIIALIGVFIVVVDNTSQFFVYQNNKVIGGLMGIATAFCISIIFTITRKDKNFAIIPSISLGSILSGLIGLSISYNFFLSINNFLPIIIMGFFILPFSFLFIMLAPKYIDTSLVSLFLLLEMVFAPFLVWLFVDEEPTKKMFFGATLVFLSVLFYVYKQYKKAEFKL